MKKIAFYILGIALIFSCRKDFVDVKDNNQVNAENYWTKPEHAFPTLIAAYAVLKYSGISGVNYFTVFHGMDPNVTSVGQSYTQYYTIDFYSSEVHIEGIYRDLYTGLDRCNTAIEKIPLCYQNASTTVEAEEGRVVVAEARFLRAVYCYYLTTLFNAPPLLTRQFTDQVLPDDYHNLSNTPQQIWFDTIYNDCRSAISLLPESWSSEYTGRATKGAAIALMAKTFMNNAKWDSAESYFNKLIVDKTGGYELMMPQGNDSLDYVFAYLCNYAAGDLANGSKVYRAENNKESVFEVQNTVESEGAWGVFLNGYNANGSFYSLYYSHAGYWNIGAANTFTAKYQSVVPTASMPLCCDPRKYATVYSSGDTVKCWEESTRCNNIIDSFAKGSDLPSRLSNKAWKTNGVTLKKYMFPLYWNADNYNFRDPNNLRLITYSDVLLYAAETKYQLGKDNEALDYINQIRRRVGLPDTAGSGQALKSIIIHEREIEKGLEGSWMPEIMRWARTKDKRTGEKYFADPDVLKGTAFIKNKNEYLPIPQYEIDYMTGGSIKQNPGW